MYLHRYLYIRAKGKETYQCETCSNTKRFPFSQLGRMLMLSNTDKRYSGYLNTVPRVKFIFLKHELYFTVKCEYYMFRNSAIKFFYPPILMTGSILKPKSNQLCLE